LKPCNQCGKCCKAYSDGGLSASTQEIDWWETHRPEIYRFVAKGQIWMSPETGEQLQVCPWLQRTADENTGREMYSCKIYFDRPEDCRHYPVTIDQMLKDDCEMLEVKDLTDYKQAQVKLDKLMSDSRPAYNN